MMDKRKTIRRLPGQMLKVDLGASRFSYAVTLREPIIAFFDREFSQDHNPSIREILELPVAFRIPIMNYAVTSGRWPIVGRTALDPSLDSPPAFWKRDAFTGKFTIYQELEELRPGFERPAAAEECLGLERAMVWEPEQAEERLIDHFAGRENKLLREANKVLNSKS